MGLGKWLGEEEMFCTDTDANVTNLMLMSPGWRAASGSFLPSFLPFLHQKHPFSMCGLHLRPMLRLAQKQRTGMGRKVIPQRVVVRPFSQKGSNIKSDINAFLRVYI